MVITGLTVKTLCRHQTRPGHCEEREDNFDLRDSYWGMCVDGKLSERLVRLSTCHQRVSIATQVSLGASGECEPMCPSVLY